MKIELKPIAWVKNARISPVDDDWNTIISTIVLDDKIPTESLDGLKEFTHLEIIYFFDKVNDSEIVFSSRPRGNPNYPLVGIFAQRKKDRPNKIGLCCAELVDVYDRTLTVKFFDAIDGTPILDIKPAFQEFQPQKEIKQPIWVNDLMSKYW